jgi:hypothetical protein
LWGIHTGQVVGCEKEGFKHFEEKWCISPFGEIFIMFAVYNTIPLQTDIVTVEGNSL